MKHIFLILFLLPVFKVSAEEIPPKIKTELITLSMDSAVNDLYLYDGEKPVPFRAVSGGISIPIPYKGPAQLVLHHKPETFELPEKERPSPAAVVLLPSDTDRVLLITFKKEGAPLRIQALPVSMKDTGAGDYHFMNFSKRQAFIVLNGQTLSLASGQSKTIAGPPAPSRTTRQDVEVKVGSQTPEGPKIYSSVWGNQADRRYFVFLLNGPTPNSPLRIQRFKDRLPK